MTKTVDSAIETPVPLHYINLINSLIHWLIHWSIDWNDVSRASSKIPDHFHSQPLTGWGRHVDSKSPVNNSIDVDVRWHKHTYKQGAYRYWKVVEFKIQIFQAWKVMELGLGPGTSWKINHRGCRISDPCTCFRPLHTLSVSTVRLGSIRC